MGKAARPTSRYQCASRPGACWFEWCCGTLCACHAPYTGTERERKDIAEAERHQRNWREHERRLPRAARG